MSFPVSVPLISSLENDAFIFIRDKSGFPSNWTRFMVSAWLGETFDRITFVALKNQDNVGYQISSQYQNIYDENDCVQLNIPISLGFCHDIFVYIYENLININVSYTNEWLQYINHGGNDHVIIKVKRYNSDDIY